MQTHRFNLFADYFQFYVQDESVEGDLSDSWTKEAVQRLLDRTRTMKRRPTRWRHGSWERVKAHPRGEREKIAALTADMVRAFMDGDLDTYWKLDRELRWLLAQETKEH